ncbi:MAG: alpha/beta fold hydrolase [Candidatus Dormiibacterota bacterium]
MTEERAIASELTVKAPGLIMVEREFRVPLDHSKPSGEQITVFAREVADPDGLDRPYLVFFQGGPGHEANRPTRHPTNPGWLDRALKDYRVLLLDQRGTGCSSPIGDLSSQPAKQQAAYLTHFRADSIVADAELIRSALGVKSWSVLGQSFGGFCVVHYLSQAPDGLREAFVTGGLPPVGRSLDDVYRATYARILERNRRFYQRYPGDHARVSQLRAWLETEDVRLPSGDRLTTRRFRQLGQVLGMSTGAEELHYMLELPAGSPAFLHDVDAALPFSRNPLYAIIHEACYADGGATGWSAARLLPNDFEQDPDLFTGEHVYPWMFEDYRALAPLREAAELLAAHSWPRLYDADRLRSNQVPCAAAIFAEDPYVERAFSEETAALIQGLYPWLTNEYDHNALRADGDRVLSRLIDLTRGRS